MLIKYISVIIMIGTAYFLLNRTINFGSNKDGRKPSKGENILSFLLIPVTFGVNGGINQYLLDSGLLRSSSGFILSIVFALIAGLVIGGIFLLIAKTFISIS